MNKIMQRYMEQVLVLQTKSPHIHQVFSEVMHMVKAPTALFHPTILMQVVKQVFNRHQPEPEFSNGKGLPTPVSVAE
jgi:hypothetical protein